MQKATNMPNQDQENTPNNPRKKANPTKSLNQIQPESRPEKPRRSVSLPENNNNVQKAVLYVDGPSAAKQRHLPSSPTPPNNNNWSRDTTKPYIHPLAFVMIPKDSEPKLEEGHTISWCQFCFQSGWNSLIFHEIWVSHFCAPLILTLGVSLLIWTYNEWKSHILLFKHYSPLSVGMPSLITGIILVVTSILMWLGSFRRIGAFIIWVICLLSLAILVCTLVICLAQYNTNYEAIDELLRELRHVYNVPGEEEDTEVFDHIQIQFKCCGVEGPKDWLTQPFVNPGKNTSKLPTSCCCTTKVLNQTCPWTACSYTKNQSDILSLIYHRKGCKEKITSYLQDYLKIRWSVFLMTLAAIVISLFFCIFYMIRVYARLATHVHPQVRSLVSELVDKADDDVFGFGTGADISNFDDQVRDYIRYNLSQCKTIAEVQEFLTAKSDVHRYIRHLKPYELSRDILSGRPYLLKRFERNLRKLKIHAASEEKNAESQREVDKKYRKQVRVRKDLHFLSKRIEHYQSFIDRVRQYHESKMRIDSKQEEGAKTSKNPLPSTST